jgi:hypothetical protein
MATGAKGDMSKRLPRPIVIGFWLTAIWVVGIVLIVAAAKPCDTSALSWSAKHLSCLSINEIGDFLAGAFAPLAFLWLVATVLVQAQELSAQREELELTRNEMRENRGVAEATRKAIEQQSETAKKSADFIGAQTKFAEEQLRQQKLTFLLEQLKSLLLARVADTTIFARFAGGAEPFFQKGHIRSTDRDQAITEMGILIRNRVERWRPELEGDLGEIAEEAEEVISLLDAFLEIITSSIDNLSDPETIRMDALGLNELKQTTNYLLTRIAVRRGG